MASRRHDGSGYTVETSASLRSFDPEAYRFDGIAEPEFRIEYASGDGSVSIRDIFVYDHRVSGAVTHYDCWCFLRDERRRFRSDRMLSIINLRTNRRVADIAAYLTR